MSELPKSSAKKGTEGLGWERAASPPSLLEEPLEIYSSRDPHGFTIDPPESSQAEASLTMPLLALRKEWFHPHFPFPYGLLIGFCLVIAPHSFEVAGMERPMHLTTLITGGSLRFEWTRITRGSLGFVLCLLPGIFPQKKHDQLQFEEHDGVNRGATTTCIGPVHELAHKRQVKRLFQMPVEVILRHQVFQGHLAKRSKDPPFLAQHRGSLSNPQHASV
jgi:hypothetical protein